MHLRHRILCLARGNRGPLPWFDETLYVSHADGKRRAWADLMSEYTIVRSATLALVHTLTPSDWTRCGVVNGYSATPRGLAFHIAAHEQHHLRIIRERYVPLLAGAR